MNRWHVYSYLKHRYMYTGEFPNIQEIQAEFTGIDQKELSEGMAEFWLALRRHQLPRYELTPGEAWQKWEMWRNQKFRQMIG